MKKQNKELVFLRSFAIATVVGLFALVTFAFKTSGNEKFGTIDVERINIVEADGTVKMVITNVGKFPNGEEVINDRAVNKKRKKRAGMIFFNEDGIECGGFIYDGRKKKDGHSAGLSLTFDKYDGDQVMQLLTTDAKKKGKRKTMSALTFYDRPEHETQDGITKIWDELDTISDRTLWKKKYKEYVDKGLIGTSTRIKLGQIPNENNGLFLYGKDGKLRAMFYVDKDNKAKLETFDGKGNKVSTWPK